MTDDLRQQLDAKLAPYVRNDQARARLVAVAAKVYGPELERLRKDFADMKRIAAVNDGLHKAAHEEGVQSEADATRLHRELLNVVHAWETQRNRAEQAEVTIERVRALAAEDLAVWTREHGFYRERADRKGYSHDEASAVAYGMAIEGLTQILAALDHPTVTTAACPCRGCSAPYAVCREDGARCCDACDHPTTPTEATGVDRG
ncbi:MAG: hypothetical protein ACRDZU_13380 [Acidimicrobiales bacterium]